MTFFDESDLSLYFDKLANEYKERILEADNKRNETKIVIEEIKKLCYPESKQVISNEDVIIILYKLKEKVKPFEQLNETVRGNYRFGSNERFREYYIGYIHDLSSHDNKNYLDLIDQTIKALGGK